MKESRKNGFHSFYSRSHFWITYKFNKASETSKKINSPNPCNENTGKREGKPLWTMALEAPPPPLQRSDLYQDITWDSQHWVPSTEKRMNLQHALETVLRFPCWMGAGISLHFMKTIAKKLTWESLCVLIEDRRRTAACCTEWSDHTENPKEFSRSFDATVNFSSELGARWFIDLMFLKSWCNTAV